MVRTLIVDDMLQVHDRFSKCPVSHAYSLEEAVQKLNSESYDLVITDYHLGESSPRGGLDIARLSKEKGLPVILMSTENLIEEAIELNIPFVFKKELFEYLGEENGRD